MDAYPLASLLLLRHFREDAAKRRLASAQLALKEAREAVVRAEETFDAWKVWRLQEVERRYEAILGQRTSIEKLDEFHRGLAALAAREMEEAMRVDAARKTEKDCEAAVTSAKRAASQARKNCAKMEAHRNLWREEEKKRLEKVAETELEDFKPVNRFGAAAEDLS